MSPASKSKSKDKLAVRAVKEQSKVSSNGGNGAPLSAYNPVLGTFHTLEISSSAPLLTPQNNGRFRDETEEHSLSSPGTTVEFDSVSNNDSCSGESEDQKDKATTSTTPRSDSIPVPCSDADKRDKIRQKNERKHQRQKEKRALELHVRCTGYLMSRKLEALVQQLVAMGFPSERATMALLVNEGSMEESVVWLLQVGKENNDQVITNLEDGGTHAKIDISDELARIADLEIEYKCSKQEVERAVVACEGDLEKAEDNLKTQKQEPAAAAQLKVEESGDPSMFNKLGMSSVQNPVVRSQVMGVYSSNIQQQQRTDGRDGNYTKAMVTGPILQESANRNLQSLRINPKPDWVREQVAAAAVTEKRLPSTSTGPSVLYPLASFLQVAMPPATSDPWYPILGSEVKTDLQAGALREPFVMQRAQSITNAKQSFPSSNFGVSASLPASTGWYSNGMSSIGMMAATRGLGHNLPSMGLSGSSPPQVYPRSQFQFSSPVESTSARQRGSWNFAGNSPSILAPTVSSLAAPSSLGLFTDWGSLRSTGSSSSVDWSTGGSLPHYDYTSIDWSLDLTPLRPQIKGDRQLSDTWSTMFMGSKMMARPVVNGVYNQGLQNSGSLVKPSSSAVSREWTSPFAGKDLFGVPRRQFVAYPSL